MSCAICETRKPRRFCPGIHGEICAPCCGAEREVSVSCPFDCEHLREARRHERVPEPGERDIPNRDIEVSESFLQANDGLVALSGRLLLEASLDVPGAADGDLREAFETLVRTYRTLHSGLYYESRPNNPLAAAIHQGFQARMAQARQELDRQAGVSRIRDNELLGALVFLQRVAVHHDNGRSRGRSFLHFLHDRFPAPPAAPPAGGPPLIVP
jgi:hypothetical protein